MAADTKARAARPIHLLVALAEGPDAVGEALSSNGPLRPPVVHEVEGRLPRRILKRSELRGGLGDALRRNSPDSLRLPQVEGAAEHFALEQGQPVLPAHLLVALLDQGDADVQRALAANELDPGSLRRAALLAVGAPEDLPPLVMPDLRWEPL